MALAETVSTGFTEDGRPKAFASQPQIGHFGFLTPQHEWGDVERGNPLPYTLPPEVRRAVGLEPETWRLSIGPDPDSDSIVEAPFTIGFEQLLQLGKTEGVQFLKGVTCNNLGEPLGMGLWEGVPLRVLVWMARPVANIRRVLYDGYHNDDPRQLFQSTLPIWRVLEEPPGDLPVIVAYRLNGEYISGKRGGPVRMVVPEAYGFTSVKWLQRVLLSNQPGANDTYRLGNNDLGFVDGQPQRWPMRWTVVHWTAQLDGLLPGEYELRWRSIDANGIAQPMPRPFAKGGRAEIQALHLTVE